MGVCLVPSAIFCKLKNEGSWGAKLLCQILFQTGKNLYGDFSDVATGLWRGLFETSRVVAAFQIGQNVRLRRPQIWTAFHVNGRRSRSESACCDSSKIVAQLSAKLPKKQQSVEVRVTWFWPTNCRRVVLSRSLCRVCWQIHCLSMYFWRSMRRQLSLRRPTLQIWPLRTFSCFLN